MPDHSEAIGTYFLPVIPSMEGIDGEVNKGMQKLLGKFGDIGKKSGAEFSKSLGGGLTAAESDVKRATAAFEKFRDKAADAAGKVRVEEERLAKARAGGKPEQVVAAEERLAKARRDETRAAQDAEQYSRRLTKARDAEQQATKMAALAGEQYGRSGHTAGRSFMQGLQQSAAGIGDVGQQAADGFSGGFGGAAALIRLGSAAGPVGVALAGLVGVATVVGKALGPAIAEGMESIRLGDLFQARLGVDDEAMRRLGGGVGQAYAEGFGASILDNYSTAQIALRSGLIDAEATEAQVTAAVKQLQGLVTVTEASGAELARSIATLMRNGLAGGISEAADIITAGFQKGLDVSGDWLDTINEYSTQARKFGLSASEYMTLLSQGLKGGARDTDKVADSLKEFAIRAVDGSKSTREGFEALGLNADDMARRFAAGGDSAKVALGATLDALKTIDDPMQQALTWQRLFGTQWEDLGGAVNSFDLSPAKNEFNSLKGVAESSTKTAADNFASSWTEATHAVEKRFNDLKTSLANWALNLPLIRDIPDLIKSLADPHYYDITAPSWAQPGIPITPSDVLGNLSGATGQPGQIPQSLADMLGGGVGGTPLPPPPDAPVPGPRTPILTDAQAEAAKDTPKPKPPRLFPDGLPSGTSDLSAALSAMVAPPAGGQVPYGLPLGSDSGGYGNDGVQFPPWVYQLGAAFNLKPSTYAGHQEGSGANRGIDWSGSPADMQRFAEYLAKTKPQGLEQVIWQNPTTMQRIGIANGKPVGPDMPGTTDPGYYRDDWAGHRDHVHTRQSLSIPLPSQRAAGAVTGLASGIGSVSRPQGTPAVNSDGEPGFWEVDPTAVREADQRAADAMDRIADADNAVALAMARLNEIDADASESQLLSAQEQLRKAQEDAKKARREAADAQADANDAKKGTFTPTKDSKNGRGGSELDGIGGIFGSFLKETFGLDGSLFPDISNLMPVQMAGAALGAFQGPLQGVIDGQTSWAPNAGDPFAGAADGGGSGTSGLPFGMIPGISSVLPDMAEPGGPAGMHNGSGAQPGPADQSTHITINNPQGDENSIADRTRRTIMRTPRTGTYTAPSAVGGG